LIVKITVENPIQPDQVAVLLQRTTSSIPALSSNSSASTAFPSKRGENGVYISKISLGSLEVSSLLGGGGAFIIHLLVGDSIIEPMDWKIAELELNSPRMASGTALWGSAEPVIHHTFRTADNRPPAILSLLFTVITVAPLAALLLSLLTGAVFNDGGVKMSLPSNPIEFSSAILFQLSLLAIILLYVLYWLQLNIFQALVGVIVLGFIAILTGNKALTTLHTKKANQAAKPYKTA